jgi:hypothetical protein
MGRFPERRETVREAAMRGRFTGPYRLATRVLNDLYEG